MLDQTYAPVPMPLDADPSGASLPPVEEVITHLPPNMILLLILLPIASFVLIYGELIAIRKAQHRIISMLANLDAGGRSLLLEERDKQ
ncbi:hypothetical protein BH18VER1_BH18VER1_10050 [soil metagenome]